MPPISHGNIAIRGTVCWLPRPFWRTASSCRSTRSSTASPLTGVGEPGCNRLPGLCMSLRRRDTVNRTENILAGNSNSYREKTFGVMALAMIALIELETVLCSRTVTWHCAAYRQRMALLFSSLLNHAVKQDQIWVKRQALFQDFKRLTDINSRITIGQAPRDVHPSAHRSGRRSVGRAPGVALRSSRRRSLRSRRWIVHG